jgi:hypothetical protein
MDSAKSAAGVAHVVMQKRTPESTITIPVPDHKELRIGFKPAGCVSELLISAASDHGL